MKNLQKIHTDTNYLSKEELKKNPDIDYSEEFWKEVQEYRDKFSFELPLLFKFNKKIHLTQTPWILQKEIKMITEFSNIQQEILTHISTMYSSTTLLEDIEIKSIVAEIHWILNKKCSKIIFSRTIIEDSINNNDIPSNKEEKEILKLYENILEISKKWTSPKEIAKIFYWQNNFKTELLNDIHNSLIATIKSDKINSLLTKSASIIFAILNNNMFGDKSYELTILSLISLLKNSYKGTILKGISFFKVFDYFKPQIEYAVKQVSDYDGDLTYLTQLMSSIIIYCVKLSSDQIENFIKKETRYNSLSTKDKNKNINNIMKNSPDISNKQANFFVSHSDLKSNYIIKDFQNYFGTSYETARYSLENLVEKGFYKKKKIGKKYVYNAIKQ